jgi:hypothetical protein
MSSWIFFFPTGHLPAQVSRVRYSLHTRLLERGARTASGLQIHPRSTEADARRTVSPHLYVKRLVGAIERHLICQLLCFEIAAKSMNSNSLVPKNMTGYVR